MYAQHPIRLQEFEKGMIEYNSEEGKTMFKATLEIATEIARDLNVSREFVWEIVKGMRYSSVEELEIKVCKAIVGR